MHGTILMETTSIPLTLKGGQVLFITIAKGGFVTKPKEREYLDLDHSSPNIIQALKISVKSHLTRIKFALLSYMPLCVTQ